MSSGDTATYYATLEARKERMSWEEAERAARLDAATGPAERQEQVMAGTKQTPTVKVGNMTPQERAAINILTPEERKIALLQSARNKAYDMVAAAPAQGEADDDRAAD